MTVTPAQTKDGLQSSADHTSQAKVLCGLELKCFLVLGEMGSHVTQVDLELTL